MYDNFEIEEVLLRTGVQPLSENQFRVIGLLFFVLWDETCLVCQPYFTHVWIGIEPLSMVESRGTFNVSVGVTEI